MDVGCGDIDVGGMNVDWGGRGLGLFGDLNGGWYLGRVLACFMS